MVTSDSFAYNRKVLLYATDNEVSILGFNDKKQPIEDFIVCTPANNTSANGVKDTKPSESSDAATQLIEPYAQLFKNGQRSPILRRPHEYDMEYEDIFFPSLDGTVLQGWLIPSKGSQKLIIANHPMTCNRYGFPGHLEGYGGFGGFEVNFLPD